MRKSPRRSLMGVLCMVVLLWGAAPPPDTPVADAAMRRDTEAVRALVKQGADVNAAHGDGMTALHWAAQNGDAELARMLLYAGANPRAATRNGAFTPLHLASKAGHADVVRALLEGGSDPNAATTTGGATALHFAVANGNLDAVRALLDGGADVKARESAWDQTPLMWAAAYNRVDVVRLLVERGAEIAATSKVEDIGAREKADREAEKRRQERVKVLWASARPAQPESAAEPGEEGAARAEAPAASEGSERQPRESRARGADAEKEGAKEPQPLSYGELVGNKGGLTPLLFATRQGHVESVLALLEAGADINQPSAGDHTTPLLMATINGHFDLAKLLLDRGADPKLASDAGTTPLYATLNVQWAPKALYPQPTAHKQQKLTYLEMMEALLKAGADPNARLTKHLWFMEYNFSLLEVDTKGATPFWRAAYATDVEAMKMLVAHGADPNIPTQKVPQRRFRRGNEAEGKKETDPSGLPPVPVGGPGVYPIHAATGVGYGEGYAANSHRHHPHGWIPAARYLIEELGADVNARDHNGYTPLHHAAARGDNEMIKYLMEKGADISVVSRKGQTVADMANGPVQRVPPFLDTVRLLESLGSKNNNKCMSC